MIERRIAGEFVSEKFHYGAGQRVTVYVRQIRLRELHFFRRDFPYAGQDRYCGTELLLCTKMNHL
jgi:hypothetical protein